QKNLWMDAIHLDKAYWNHILLDQKVSDSLFDDYCISGIPHIILVNPEGIIVAKEIRGENIITVPKAFIL
ncbi:MAG: AhpC/TSA family protein, partial [Odoribacter sp.]